MPCVTRCSCRSRTYRPRRNGTGWIPRCDHVLAISEDGKAIGCGRLTPEHKIGRMAVLADWRGRGVGAAMLQMLIEIARERGWESVSLHAQVTAIDFYQKHGFDGVGERFMEAGIEHWTMQRTLEPIEPPPAERGTPPARPEAENLKCTTRSELKNRTADPARTGTVQHLHPQPVICSRPFPMTTMSWPSCVVWPPRDAWPACVS